MGTLLAPFSERGKAEALGAWARSAGALHWAGVVLDGAHVDFVLRAVMQELSADARCAARPVVVLALGPDKNAAAMVGVLAGAATWVVCTRAGGGRAGLAPRQLQQCCASHGIPSEAIDDPHVALARALDAVGDGGWVLVTGSLHLAGTLRASLAACTSAPGGSGS